MDPVYLKIQPETFSLEHRQLFLIKKCQFCGSDHLNYRKMGFNTRLKHKDRIIKWAVRCDDCKNAVGLLLEPHKEQIPG